MRPTNADRMAIREQQIEVCHDMFEWEAHTIGALPYSSRISLPISSRIQARDRHSATYCGRAEKPRNQRMKQASRDRPTPIRVTRNALEKAACRRDPSRRTFRYRYSILLQRPWCIGRRSPKRCAARLSRRRQAVHSPTCRAPPHCMNKIARLVRYSGENRD